MKKLLLSMLCIAMFVGVSNAQKVKWSVKGGVNISNIYGDDGDTNCLAGVFVGGSMEYKLSSWAYGFDLLYSQKGAQSDSTLEGAIGNDVPEIHLNYISFIPTVKYYFNNNFNLQAGIELAYNTEAEVTYKGSSNDIEDINNFDAGIVLGGEYIFDMGFGLIGRYCMGLNPINDDNSDDVTNGTLQLGVSYRF